MGIMFLRLMNRFKNSQNAHKAGCDNHDAVKHKADYETENAKVSTEIEKNKDFLIRHFKNSSDVILYDFLAYSNIRVLIVYINGLVNKEVLNRDIITPLMQNFEKDHIQSSIFVSDIKEENIMSEVVIEVLCGKIALFAEDFSASFLLDVRRLEQRSIEEPDIEPVIRGPKEGFIESIGVNISLIRKIIKNNNLVFQSLKLGKQTKTNIAIAYIDGIVNEAVLTEVRRRINCIDTDSILESGYIEQFIEDSPFSFFPTVGNTQKPDVAAAKLLEGRIAIFCDGTPHVLTIPYLFEEGLQTSEDYYIRPFLASLLRILRLTALLISVLLPAVYVALSTFHQEMIPTVLLISMAGAKEGIPLPAFAEALVMGVLYELLRESGTRLPRAIGPAISIVGALVIGEAAVNAGLVSAPMVIITAVTAVTSFVIPVFTEVMAFYRLGLLIFGGIMGLYGVICGIYIMVAQAVSLRSFGVPYASGFGPFNLSDMKDFLLRAPLWMMKRRPQSIAKNNKKRQGNTRRK